MEGFQPNWTPFRHLQTCTLSCRRLLSSRGCVVHKICCSAPSSHQVQPHLHTRMQIHQMHNLQQQQQLSASSRRAAAVRRLSSPLAPTTTRRSSGSRPSVQGVCGGRCCVLLPAQLCTLACFMKASRCGVLLVVEGTQLTALPPPTPSRASKRRVCGGSTLCIITQQSTAVTIIPASG